MTSRRWSVLSALLLTACILWMLPAAWRQVIAPDSNRMDIRLRPSRLRTLTVWKLPEDFGDGKLLRAACSAFEKQHDGVRIFLRTATAAELYAPDAVLPDIVLFGTGEIVSPENLLPLDQTHPSGMHAGQALAVPLWLSPNVLSLPCEWLGQPAAPAAQSLLAHATPVPQKDRSAVLSASQLPWEMLLAEDGLVMPHGVALQQLMLCCPEKLTELASTGKASVEPLAKYQKRLSDGEALCAFPLTPAVSDRVRYAALCRDGEDARAFLAFLMKAWQPQAPAHGLLPLQKSTLQSDPLLSSLQLLFSQNITLPNAFAHTREELNALCLDGFVRLADPVETLLQLR